MASNNRYYIDGHSITFSNRIHQTVSADNIAEQLHYYIDYRFIVELNHDAFDAQIETFIEANRDRLNYLKEETHDYIVAAFSGAKALLLQQT